MTESLNACATDRNLPGILGVIVREGAEPASGDWLDRLEKPRSSHSLSTRSVPICVALGLPPGTSGGLNQIRAYIRDYEAIQGIRTVFNIYQEHGLELHSGAVISPPKDEEPGIWQAYVSSPDTDLLFEALMHVEFVMRDEKGVRANIFASGQNLRVFTGNPDAEFNPSRSATKAPAWLTHIASCPISRITSLPVQPLSFLECAVAFQGTLGSSGMHRNYLSVRGYHRLLRTDVEIVVLLLDYLLRHMGLTIRDTATILTMPHEQLWPSTLGSEERAYFQHLSRRYRGAILDGTFTLIAGYTAHNDTYLFGLGSRRSLDRILVAQEEDRFCLATEESQLRALLPDADVWASAPGSLVLISARHGLLTPRQVLAGRQVSPKLSNEPTSMKTDMSERLPAMSSPCIQGNANESTQYVYLEETSDQHTINAYLIPGYRICLQGTAGDGFAQFNYGSEVFVYGNAGSDLAHAMQDGRVHLHGDTRESTGSDLQGGRILIRGSSGSRAGLRMQSGVDEPPCLIVGNRADDWLGECMSGGIIIVLGIDLLDQPEAKLVGEHVASGMTGGRIYIRGKVSAGSIGDPPNPIDVRHYIEGLLVDEQIDQNTCHYLLDQKVITAELLKEHLDEVCRQGILCLYESQSLFPVQVQYGMLDEEDLGMMEPVLHDFFTAFQLDAQIYRSILRSDFTQITPLGRTN